MPEEVSKSSHLASCPRVNLLREALICHLHLRYPGIEILSSLGSLHRVNFLLGKVLVFSSSFATISSSWPLTPVSWPRFPTEEIKLFRVMLVALMALKRCLVSLGHLPHVQIHTLRIFPLLPIPHPSIKWDPFKPCLVRGHLATVKSSGTPGLHYLPSLTLCQPLPSSCLALLPGFGILRILQLKW